MSSERLDELPDSPDGLGASDWNIDRVVVLPAMLALVGVEVAGGRVQELRVEVCRIVLSKGLQVFQSLLGSRLLDP